MMSKADHDNHSNQLNLNNDEYSHLKVISPHNKCGYVAIWIALLCKKSHLIDKYNITKATDLYTLLRYGSDQYPSLFEEENVKKFYEKCSDNDKKYYDEYKKRLIDGLDGTTHAPYFVLVSLYFNINLITLLIIGIQ